ncbi:putative vacuolar protein sorting-associated protein 35 [Babesia divergens]|uniref:Vacuolar protein sorting-associated protein 35 n=1 Tax=Babesia divergens TaxID=32595 RepID=A0AAD9GDJ4_BABDI|nr:putative vacuolar protein sorting-associated protein 35 [Babesia divergens]
MRRHSSDLEDDGFPPEGGCGSIDQCKLLEEALFYVKEHAYYMRQALDGEDIEEALKRAINVISELRTSTLTPTNYYELYMKVFNELQMLSEFMGNDSKRGMTIQRLYENVQQCCFILPRLYLLIMVGAHRIRANVSLSNDILKDISELCRGVQHPMRGLFLRYFLVQICKDSLPDADDSNKDGTLQSFEFLLWNFNEAVRLWVRLNHGSTNLMEQRRRNKERLELGLLVGSNLVRMAQLEGLDAEFYTEIALPKILGVIADMHDMQARRYILDCLIQAFSDEYHLKSLHIILKSIVTSITSDDCISVLTNLMQRLSQYFLVTDLSIEDSVPGDLFEVFHEHINTVDFQKGITMKGFLALQTSFLDFTSTVYPGIIEHIESIIKHVREFISIHLQGEGELDDDTFDSVIKLHTIPLQTLGLRSLKIFENTWMKGFIPKHKHSSFSRAIVDAMVQYEVYVTDRADLETIFEFDCPFFFPSLNAYTSPVREEQVYMSRFIHMIRSNDVMEQFEMYRILLDRMVAIRPFRYPQSIQTLMVRSLQLIFKLFEPAGDVTPVSKPMTLEETKRQVRQMLKFFNEMVRLVQSAMPEDTLKLLAFGAIAVNELCDIMKLDMHDSSNYDDFGVICYNFIASACIIFEEELVESQRQLRCLCYLLSVFSSRITILNDDHYREMSARLAKYSIGLLKVEHKFSALAHVSNCFSNGRDTSRVRWAMERALKIAESHTFETRESMAASMKPVRKVCSQLRDRFDLSDIMSAINSYVEVDTSC